MQMNVQGVERLSLDLMGKRSAGKGEREVVGGSWRNGQEGFSFSSYDERREKRKKGGHRDPDESRGRGGMKGVLRFCSLHFSLI